MHTVAAQSGTSYVDMFSLLNALTAEARKTDPAFTLIRDAVHPDPPGQLVMAYAMIDDLGLRKQLSNIRIQPAPGGDFQASTTGGKVTKLKRTDDGLEFEHGTERCHVTVFGFDIDGVDSTDRSNPL